MAETPQSLGELASRYGVATEYQDWTGRHVDVPETTLVAVLAALGVPAATEDERSAALASHDRDHWTRSLPPTIVARSDSESSFWVHVTHGEPVGLWIRLEDGSVRAGLRQLENDTPPYDLGDRLVGEATFELPPDLPLGYHRLYLQAGSSESSAPLIVVPAKLELPLRLGGKRIWGLATQLYSVQSERSWGVGDLTDLTDLAVWSGANHGAGYILVNPMHAAAPVAPMEPSPYLPTSRRYVNPLYLRPEAIPEFAEVGRRSRIRRRRLELQKEARHADLIDRDAAWDAKRDVLETVYRVERSAGRQLAYEAYRAREGRSLDDFAIWCALAERHGPDWHRWPKKFTRPSGTAVAGFAAKHAETVDFHRWLQWQLDDQLATAQSTALRAGMELGIMHDLAVGVDPNGADAWAMQDVLALGVTAGAPPDEFNQLGQDWSQPPWRPDQLVSQGYEPFRAMVNAILRHASGIRVDHIIGLFRLWWIPKGALPTEGTYVRYDHEAMIGILALEAHRAEAVVVGEDLGTVEPWVRDYLARRGLLGTSILWFELDRDGDGGPLAAQRWREYCLSSVTTHDLPPTAGYLAGEHVRLRAELGLLTRPVEEELADDRLRAVGVGRRTAARGPAWREARRRRHRSRAVPISRSHPVAAARPFARRRGRRDAHPEPAGYHGRIPELACPAWRPRRASTLLEEVFSDPRAASLCEALRAAVNTQV